MIAVKKNGEAFDAATGPNVVENSGHEFEADTFRVRRLDDFHNVADFEFLGHCLDPFGSFSASIPKRNQVIPHVVRLVKRIVREYSSGMQTEFRVPKIWPNEPAFILGGGPSIKGFDFKRIRGRGRVFAVNDAGIVENRAPWADVLYFSDRRWLEWNHGKLQNHFGEWKISRQPMSWPLAEGVTVHKVDFLSRRWSDWPNAVGGWCGGSQAINLAYLFGCNPIILLGFDMREQAVMNWHANHKQPHVANQHRDHFIPCFETVIAPALRKRNVTVINTNPRSGLRCFPFASIEEILAMDDIAKIERAKYLEVWQRDEYRRVSPGMFEVERATKVMGVEPGSSLIDFGSGPCRATKWFMDRGVNVLAIDFAANAREFPDVPFVEACLWDDLNGVGAADFGFCCDVMEHIPREKVDAVLQNINRLSKRAAYFRIATRPDVMGKRLINKPLHVTVESADWWRKKLENNFGLVDVVEQNDRDIMVLVRQ